MMRLERMSLAIVLVATTAAFAQHGRGGGMGSPGMGGPGMGSGHTMGGPENSHKPADSVGAQAPDKVLSHNTAIASKIKALTGQDATAACSGFKNLGQCVAAAHVSKNLGIPFADLKNKMTGSGSESLGKAIKDLKPSANSKQEAKTANKQAEQDLNGASS
jgi:hypothetical protein